MSDIYINARMACCPHAAFIDLLTWNRCPTYNHDTLNSLQYTVRVPVFGRHQFFGTSEHYGKAHGSLLSGWMNYNYTACCWFPTSSNILILPSQFWQIGFESCWLHCSKCRILVISRYPSLKFMILGVKILAHVSSRIRTIPHQDHSPPGQFPTIQVLVLMSGLTGLEWSWWGVVLGIVGPSGQ